MSPVTAQNMNYSPIALAAIVLFAGGWWLVDARFWFKGPKALVQVAQSEDGSTFMVDKVGTKSEGDG